MWHAEKWYRGTYLESRNGNPDVENRHVDTGEWVVVVEIRALGDQGSHTHSTTGTTDSWWEAADWHREPSWGSVTT